MDKSSRWFSRTVVVVFMVSVAVVLWTSDMAGLVLAAIPAAAGALILGRWIVKRLHALATYRSRKIIEAEMRLEVDEFLASF